MHRSAARLAEHAGQVGEVSTKLAALSRLNVSPVPDQPDRAGGFIQAVGTPDHCAGEAASIAADKRSKSAFLWGAAQTLEGNIIAASAAIATLLALFDDTGTAAFDPVDLILSANCAMGRLNDATRQISETIAFVDKVALQTNRLPFPLAAQPGLKAAAHAVPDPAEPARHRVPTIRSLASNIIINAALARQTIDDACHMIASLRDSVDAIANEPKSDAHQGHCPSAAIVSVEPMAATH